MSEVLSTQQVDALQAVDLRLGWVRHGRMADSYTFGFPRENGPAMYGVADTDYAIPAALLSDMGPGDISVRERIFNQDWWGEAPSDATVLSDVNSLLLQSPYVDRSPLRDIEDYDELLRHIQADASPAATHDNPALRHGLAASLDLLRNLRIGDPFLYVDGLAITKGIRRAIADSPNEALTKGEISIAQRNSDMARGLGNIAVRLARSGNDGDTPKVAFTAGRGHQQMEKILDSYGIAYVSMAAKRPLADKLFDLSDFFMRPSTSSSRYARHWSRSWFKNLRRQGHAPINETLGETHFPA